MACDYSRFERDDKEYVTLWGREYEVLFRWEFDPFLPEFIHPNGRLDMSKFGIG